MYIYIYRLIYISTKTVLIFPKNLLNFKFDAIEKQGMINPSHCRSKLYGSVVFGESEVTVLREGDDAAFRPCLFCIHFILGFAK